MQFCERHEYVSKHFDPQRNVNEIDGSGMSIRFMPFTSVYDHANMEAFALSRMRRETPGGGSDDSISENKHFVYPVFMPAGAPGRRVIIMLHGLNERKWDKYLAWAHYLTEKTGRPVILFPVSFHINRSLPEWLNPRLLVERAAARKELTAENLRFSTFVNLTLSERLCEAPERFFLSGLQTTIDLHSLLNQLREGRHPLFEPGTSADFFAYSIGGLLAQVMFIANPAGLLSDARIFLFCAGSLFSEMNGISRVIIDEAANDRIQHYYRYELEDHIKRSGVFSSFFNSSKFGMAFRSMIAPDRFRKVRERVFRKHAGQILAVSLKKDRVIPPERISTTLLGSGNRLPGNMEVYDFSYPYSHEVPFPVRMKDVSSLVDEAFEKVFQRAAIFLG